MIDLTFSKIEATANDHGIGLWSWLAPATAALVAMNSPQSIITLFKHAAASKPLDEQILIAEFMREIGLRCIAIVGIPTVIDILDDFRSSLPSDVSRALCTEPTRDVEMRNKEAMFVRGRELWTNTHRPYGEIIEMKHKEAHPDLPAFIIDHEYGFLLAESSGAVAGRASGIRTSLSAIACLQAHGAKASQLFGHIHGLRKAWEDGSWSMVIDPDKEDAFEWLVSDAGCAWLLDSVDELVREVGMTVQTTVQAKL